MIAHSKRVNRSFAREETHLHRAENARTGESLSPLTAALSQRQGREFIYGFVAMLVSPLILTPIGMFMGFGSVAAQLDFDILWTLAASALLFSAPAQLLLVGGISHATSLLGLAIAVSCMGVRFAPMTATLIPLLKSEKTSWWKCLFPAHCAVISLWMEASRLLPQRPVHSRLPYCYGLAASFFSVSLLSTALGYRVATSLPPLLVAALLFVTPTSLLLVTLKSTRSIMDKLAFAVGGILAVATGVLNIQIDMMWIGVFGGAAAFLACTRWKHA